MGILIEIPVHRLTSPERNVIQIDHIVVCAAIDEGTEFAVADGQRLFEIVGRTVVLQHHGCLLLGCHACRGKQGKGEKQILSSHEKGHIL